MKKFLLLIGLCSTVLFSQAQLPCDSISATFRHWQERMNQLSSEDPEIISLHYLFLQDIRHEIDNFRGKTLPQLTSCLQTDYYETKSQFNKIVYKAEQLEQLLGQQKNRVDQIFYEQAVEELAFFDTSNALYNLDRALEFNKYQPQSLLLKAQLVLCQNQYQEAVDLIHILYTKAELDEALERDVSDFTLVLYEKLYSKGDELAKSGHSADALEIFLALEQFCSNMPSGYCNEDYYQGIIRSREGVYDSYIAIAKEAEKRHNTEMAKKFYRYAEEYKKSGNQ